MSRIKKETDSMSDSLESLETKSSMSGSANSMRARPKPFGLALILILVFLLLTSIGGLTTSAVEFRKPSSIRRTGVTQSFVLFSCLTTPVYIFMHLIVSFGQFEFSRRQTLQSPVVSWAVILARISFLLWLVTVILTSVTIAHGDDNTHITRSNLALAIFGLTCMIIMILRLELSANPFELPFAPRKSTVTCLVSSFEEDLKRNDYGGGGGGGGGRHYRTMTMDSASSHSSSSSPPSSPIKRPQMLKRPIVVEETAVAVETRMSPAVERPVLPDPVHVLPPGTAWAQDWDQLAVDAGMRRNGSVSEYSTAESDHVAMPKPMAQSYRPGLPRIVVTPT